MFCDRQMEFNFWNYNPKASMYFWNIQFISSWLTNYSIIKMEPHFFNLSTNFPTFLSQSDEAFDCENICQVK